MPCRRPDALLLLSILGAATIAGCDSDQKFPPICPSLALLRDAADLTRYNGAGRDIRDLMLQARLTAVPAVCSLADPTHVRARLEVAMDLTRGPATHADRVEAPYFVGVTEAGHVLDEQDYSLEAVFPPNIDQVHVTSDAIDLLLPISRQKTAAVYQIFVGFRLTPEELADNRAHRK